MKVIVKILIKLSLEVVQGALYIETFPFWTEVFADSFKSEVKLATTFCKARICIDRIEILSTLCLIFLSLL